jgi:hypothetical protein
MSQRKNDKDDDDDDDDDGDNNKNKSRSSTNAVVAPEDLKFTACSLLQS